MADYVQQYRPKTLEEVVGQQAAVNTLIELGRAKKLPQVLLLTSQTSGVGKTSIARILRDKLGCRGSDYQEINCAQDGGIEHIRGIQSRVNTSALYGKCRIWYFDEVQALSRASFAAQAMLKLLEDSPPQVRFILATTDKGKILPTIVTRCLEIKLQPVPERDLILLIKRVAAAEKIELTDLVISRLVDLANGSPRQVLQDLQRIAYLRTEGERLAVLQPPEIVKQAFDLVKALVWQRAKWSAALAILKRCPIQEAEGFRQLMLACANTELMKGGEGSHRAWQVATAFQFPIWDWEKAAIAAIVYQLTGDGK